MDSIDNLPFLVMGKEKTKLSKTHRKNYPSHVAEMEGWRM
jgi:hypothetical protein